MKKLVAIGEALIDMIPGNTGRILDVESFAPKVGGAPLNVCGAYTALGGESSMITMLGKDAFGEKIIKEMQRFHIHTDYIKQTSAANTSLAFVALDEQANREFSFYRNMGADMLLSENDIEEAWFEDCYGLHFCSVSLGDFPMKKAHDRAIELAKKKKLLISFDPNVRLPLFEDHEYLRKTIHAYIRHADILKISDEEVSFLFGSDAIEEHLAYIFACGVKLLIYTAGKDGASAYTRYHTAYSAGIEAKAVDTTGAGDGFIGCFLYQLSKDEISASNLEGLREQQLKSYLDMCNKFCSISVTKEGAIASYPSMLQ